MQYTVSLDPASGGIVLLALNPNTRSSHSHRARCFYSSLAYHYRLQRRSLYSLGNKKTSLSLSNPPLVIVLITIYEAVVATLAGTYFHPLSSLQCGLDERWAALFRNKNEQTIKRIQDAFECCGLHSVLDKAWPFEGHGNKPNTCTTRFARSTSCFTSWRAEERRVASLMLVVVLLVFAWKVC